MSGATTDAFHESLAGYGRAAAGRPARYMVRGAGTGLADPVQFLAHVMVLGSVDDLKALRGIVGKDDYREVLEQAPPGIFDARSWAYWNLVCGRQSTPPLPVRAGLQPIRPTPR